MPDDLPQPDSIDAALEQLPPASTMQGHDDDALITARHAGLLRDRALGFTYEEIATRHGYADKSSARKALLAALNTVKVENAADLRVIENERYELDQRTLRLIIGGTDVKPELRIRAIDARTRAAARHARLNGLDAPVQVQISAGVQQELAAALEDAGRVLGVVQGETLDVHDEPLEA